MQRGVRKQSKTLFSFFACAFVVSVFLWYKYVCVRVMSVSVRMRVRLPVARCRQRTNVGGQGVCGMLESGLLVYCAKGINF